MAGDWRDSRETGKSFRAFDPGKKISHTVEFPVSGPEEVIAIVEAGKKAAVEMRSLSPETIASFLEQYARNIEERENQLIEMANAETALPMETRLRAIELPRTTNQIRQAASAVRERSWCQATIDTKSNIHSKFGALGGPVVVFGPNNFPFAFNSLAGSDFVSAIAAGNPVIAKANPGHPGTTRIFAEAAFEAMKSSRMPLGSIQLFYHTPPEVGLLLVSHPSIGATAFTGSRIAGLKLKEASDRAGKPIYLEMSSVNPVILMPGALRNRAGQIAAEFYNSSSMGAGQFCTNPGILILQDNADGEAFVQTIVDLYRVNPPGTLLSPDGPSSLSRSVDILTKAGAEVLTGGMEAEENGYSFQNTLLSVTGDVFIEHAEKLQTEMFGTSSLIVKVRNPEQMVEVTERFEGNLTASIYSDIQGEDDWLYQKIEPELRTKVGRLLNDKMPTSVTVVSSMNHGGPFPATGHPGFTAVGIPGSFLRFAALQCYDNVRAHRLPPELQDNNPTGRMWRLIDGKWSVGNVN